MSETIDSLVKMTAYELPDGSRITRSEQKADPKAGVEAGISFWHSIPPKALNIPDEAVKAFAEYLILNPAMESKGIEKGIYPDRFEFKVIFTPLNDPDREHTQQLNLKGFVDDSEATGFRLEFTPELKVTESLKKIFELGFKRIARMGVVRILTEKEFEELAKNGREVESNIGHDSASQAESGEAVSGNA